MSPQELGTVSIRRNEIISDLFFRMDKVERLGTGIRKMKEAMLGAGLRDPDFVADSFFRAVFHRSPEYAMKVGERVGDKLTANQRQILELISENAKIAASALSRKVGISRRKIETNLANLKSMGILERVGPPKGGHWKILID